jgi:CheY-like chemotaxis protein
MSLSGLLFGSGTMPKRTLGRLAASTMSVASTGDGSQQHVILAIDDESEFLRLLKFALESQGYKVHTASDPTEGIRFYGEWWRTVSMVLLDYLLPEMPGDLVFESLQQLNPDVRVVLVTGCEESVAENMLKNGLRGYLQKPFDLPDLARKVQEAITAPATAFSQSPTRSSHPINAVGLNPGN